MSLRLILQGFAFLILFSSCSKQSFLFSENTGGYGGYHKSKEKSVPASDKILNDNKDKVIITVSTSDEQLNIPTNTTIPATQTFSELKFKRTYNIDTPEPIVKIPEGKKNFGLNYLPTSVHKKNTDAPFKVTPSESSTFSILSIIFALAPILLSILIGSGIVYLLGIPAIIFGIIGLSKKEKLRWLALIGLILGLLEVSVIVIAFVILSNM